MKKTNMKAPELSAIIPACQVFDGGPLSCRDAGKDVIVRAYRSFPDVGIQRIVFRLMGAFVEKFGVSVRLQFSLMTENKGMQHE